MRVLLLLRGAPGCGKTTFINDHGLTPYALSADQIRRLCQSPVLTPEGSYITSQANDKIVWEILFNLLQVRMEKGEFTIIDATNSKTVEMNRYKEYADKYRYRIYCVDFTSLPIEECKRRNLNRPEFQHVPESVIDLMYSRFQTQQIPSGIKVIQPDELDSIYYKKIDLSSYNAIRIIGDIHGCYTVLQEYLNKVCGILDDEFYIFVGDYIDRGLENVDVLKFLISIKDRKNVLLLEGNHERWIWCYANDLQSKSKEFEFKTVPQLNKAISQGIFTKRDLRQLYRKLGQCAYFDYHGQTIFVSHGGIPRLPKNLTFLASDQLIHGVGRYEDHTKILEAWTSRYLKDHIQVHGHRNTRNDPIQFDNHPVYNLEGRVEFGGDLRCVSFYPQAIECHYTKNTVFKDPEEFTKDTEIIRSDIASVVLKLRKNRFITEKNFGDVSSFNFNRQAFYNKEWNEQTITARGLYINLKEMKVQARGYAKFFNLNERPETRLEALQSRFQFPLHCYVKENEYLGLLSYDHEKDDLFFATKSVINSDYCEKFKDLFYSTQNSEGFKEFLKTNDVTLAFEVIDSEFDPHIIEYNNPHIILLDCIENDLKFKKYTYGSLEDLGRVLGITIKTKAYTLNDWNEFYNWYQMVTQKEYKFNNEYIEGFVIEDSAGFMVKIKLNYYNFWKFMRTVAQATLRSGYFKETSALTDPEANRFYGWLKEKRKNLFESGELEKFPRDIIYLRKMFYQQNLSIEEWRRFLVEKISTDFVSLQENSEGKNE